jgi:UDP-N-acetylglucosamine--N-acetylmuramyl-(pentapeptide) pyrophosphoryl-undecaprenol N-acetylglucosamine transferase
LPELVGNYQIIHQTGKANFDDVVARAGIALDGNDLKSRYKPFAFLNPLAMRMAAGVANVVVTRAGSSLFEIASWGVPAIVIPITNTNNDHQKKKRIQLCARRCRCRDRGKKSYSTYYYQ